MPITTAITVSVEEARAIYQTVRAGRLHFQEHPHPNDDRVTQNQKAYGVAAERFASQLLEALGNEVYTRPTDDPERIALGETLDLYDAAVPPAYTTIKMLCEQEERSV